MTEKRDAKRTDRAAKRDAKKWARAERDVLNGKADAGYVATHTPKQEKRTEEGGSSG